MPPYVCGAANVIFCRNYHEHHTNRWTNAVFCQILSFLGSILTPVLNTRITWLRPVSYQFLNQINVLMNNHYEDDC